MNDAKSSRNREAGEMSDGDFNRLSKLVLEETGISLSLAKKYMLATRIQKRLYELGMKSFGEYCDYLFSQEGRKNELVHAIDAVSTNKTHFFRESTHYEYLVKTALPGLAKTCGAGVKEKLMVWSAACSTGEEPYTLAMVLEEHRNGYPAGKFDYSILATDISTRVLGKARLGIYDEQLAESIQMDLRNKYLLRSRDRTRKLVRIVPELRKRVEFRNLNLTNKVYGIRRDIADVIFCRNVIIYFDRPTRELVLNHLCRYLRPGGYLFMGHSESLHDVELPLIPTSPMVYRKDEK
ncbi:MAG: methyltransferase domain-containing protein [Planctomycetes bacterium]|nr:methyltransferase domain-containing protein [Planctomycetota bacterium]